MMMNLPCLRGSCPNFLRSIYHSLSASQAPKRGHAPRKKTMPATALVFMFDCYWPAFTCRGTDLLSGRYTISGSCWSFADAFCSVWGYIIHAFMIVTLFATNHCGITLRKYQTDRKHNWTHKFYNLCFCHTFILPCFDSVFLDSNKNLILLASLFFPHL